MPPRLSLSQRLALSNVSPGVVVDVPAATAVDFAAIIGTFNLTPGQWWQFIGLWVVCSDLNSSGELSLSELSLFVQLGAVRVFSQGRGIPDNPIGGGGASLGIAETALFSLNDYLQEAGTNSTVTLAMGARVINADPVNPQQATFMGATVAEIYNTVVAR